MLGVARCAIHYRYKNTLISATKILNSDGATFKYLVFRRNKCEIQVGKQVIAKATLDDKTRLCLLDGKLNMYLKMKKKMKRKMNQQT